MFLQKDVETCITMRSRSSEMFYTIGPQMAVRLLVLIAGRSLPPPPRRFLLLISVKGSVAGSLKCIEKLINRIGD
jgi:hypothetical protein